MVAKVDEQQMAVIALAMHPPRKANRLADIVEAQLRAVVGAIGVHDEFGSARAENCGEKRAPRFNGGKLFVNPRGRR
jgi:hypothetical protein